MMKPSEINESKQTFSGKRVLIGLGCLVSISASLSPFAEAAEFGPPNINGEASSFESRFGEQFINVDFIVANAIGRARKIARESTEGHTSTTNQTDDETVVGDSGPAISGSIVIQPGSDVNGAVIVNIVNGNTTSIDR